MPRKAKLPPGLSARTYTTQGGYKRTLYIVRLTDRFGRRHKFSVGPDLEFAKEEARRLQLLRAKGHDFTAPALPEPKLFPWADHWLVLNAEKKSRDKDRRSVKRLKEFFMEDPQLEEIVSSRTKAYRNHRRGQVGDSTINRELACLRSILLLAHKDGVLARMPAIVFEVEYNQRERTATEEEYQSILTKLSGESRDVVEVLWEMGFRVSEVLEIQVGDLDLAQGVIDMARLRKKRGIRTQVPLSPRALEILSEKAKGKKTDQAVFRVDRDFTTRRFQRACQDLGITGLWLHDLRASFVTRKMREGRDRELIKMFTGHRTDHAFRRYSRPTLEDLKQVVLAPHWPQEKRRKAETSVSR